MNKVCVTTHEPFHTVFFCSARWKKLSKGFFPQPEDAAVMHVVNQALFEMI